MKCKDCGADISFSRWTMAVKENLAWFYCECGSKIWRRSTAGGPTPA